MGTTQSTPAGPDLAQGIPAGDLPEGRMLAGHVGDEAVLLARRGDEFFAIGATCTHYGGPLAEGLVVGDTVRCPWHHACFSLRTGEALHAPALSSGRLLDGRAARRHGSSCATRRAAAAADAPARSGRAPERIVIVGGGAAGFAAAEMLRREGYAGQHRHAEPATTRRPSIGRICRRTISPATRRRTGSRCGRDDFYAEQRHRPAARDATSPRIDVAAREVALADGQHDRLRPRCCSRPAPSRCGCRSRAPTCRTCTPALARRQPRHHRRAPRARSAPS